MQIPTAISFRGLAASEALRSEIVEHVRRTGCVLEDILACRVLVESDAHGVHPGSDYAVHVRMTMPCIELEAGGAARPLHRRDPHLAVMDAFAELSAHLDAFIAQRCRACLRFGRLMVR